MADDLNDFMANLNTTGSDPSSSEAMKKELDQKEKELNAMREAH